MEEKKVKIITKKILKKQKKVKIITEKMLERDDWKIRVFNDTLQKQVSNYNANKGINPEISEIKYKNEPIFVFETTPEFILLLRGNKNYEKTKDFILFHKRKGVNEKWRIFSK